MLYDAFKALHVIGVIVLVGNVTITAFWKVYADRSADPRIVAHAQRAVTVADWIFTLGGIVLVYVGGFGAAKMAGLDPFATTWLVWGQGLFLLSGGLWIGVLVPIQIRQARQARTFAAGGPIPASYRIDSRRWLVWGIIATVPLVIAVWVMVAKP